MTRKRAIAHAAGDFPYRDTALTVFRDFDGCEVILRCPDAGARFHLIGGLALRLANDIDRVLRTSFPRTFLTDVPVFPGLRPAPPDAPIWLPAAPEPVAPSAVDDFFYPVLSDLDKDLRSAVTADGNRVVVVMRSKIAASSVNITLGSALAGWLQKLLMDPPASRTPPADRTSQSLPGRPRQPD